MLPIGTKTLNSKLFPFRLQFLFEFLNLFLLVIDRLEQFVQFLVLYRGRILFLNQLQEIGQHIHIVDESIVRRLLVGCTLVDVVHVVEIVHILQAHPVGLQALILAEMYSLRHGIEFIQCLLLQVVAHIDA